MQESEKRTHTVAPTAKPSVCGGGGYGVQVGERGESVCESEEERVRRRVGGRGGERRRRGKCRKDNERGGIERGREMKRGTSIQSMRYRMKKKEGDK
jgi:hypothetical protein